MSRETAIQTTSANQIEVPAANAPATPEQPQGWGYLPAVDVLERPERYVIEFDAPGLHADRIQLTFESGVLHLHGPVQHRYPEDVRFLRQEYGIGDFDRAVQLGRIAAFVDGDRISATYDAGVLTVDLPKLASAQTRTIKVNAA